MADIWIILLWLIATLAIASFAGLVGKKYGVEYPIAIMASLIVVANILANKIVIVGPFTVPAGVLVYSVSFLVTDILSEKWSKSHARKAVWAGFYANVIMVVSVYIAISWTAAPFAAEQAGLFGQVLGMTPRIVLASMIAYLISQHYDVWSFHFWKKKTKGKHLWLRNNASTIVSQFVDSTLFITIAFYGIFPVVPLIIGQWVVKVAIALIDTPFMYGIIWLMDKVKAEKT